MAKNTHYDSDSTHRAVQVEHESEIESGDPVAVGSLPGVALIDAVENSAEYDDLTIDTAGVYDFTVKAAKKAIEWGTKLYIKEGALSEEEGGTFFGYAMGEVEKEKEGEIPVHIGY